jgi:EmrB/QacA subfamily drug resistance transporter
LKDTLKRTTLAVAMLTSFMGPFLMSSVNIALPDIQQAFGADAVLLSWIATAYLLSMAATLVPVGKVADRWGRVRMFAWGLVILVLASLAAAMAPSMNTLIATRIFQGMGAAMVVTTGMPILIAVFPPKERGRAIGLYVAAVYLGLSAGPLVGGLLTQHGNWRLVFVAAAPVNLLALFLTLRYLGRGPVQTTRHPFDIPGTLLYGLSLILVVYGASRLPAASAWGLIVGGVIGLTGFIFWELRSPDPVFEIRLFAANRVFAFSSLAALINYSATFAVTFLMSLYLQYIQGFSPQSAGLILVAQPIVQAMFSPFSGRLSDRIEPSLLASSGMAITALGLVALACLAPATGIVYILSVLFSLGVGFALFSSPNMNAIMGAIDQRHYATASGVVATMRLLGQMTSMAIATLVFALVIGPSEILPPLYPQFLASMRICFGVSAVLCFSGIFFSACRGRLRPPC